MSRWGARTARHGNDTPAQGGNQNEVENLMHHASRSRSGGLLARLGTRTPRAPRHRGESATRQRGWSRRKRITSSVASGGVVAGVVLVSLLAGAPAQAASNVPMPQTPTWGWSYAYTGTGTINAPLNLDNSKIYVANVASPWLAAMSSDASGQVIPSANTTGVITSGTSNGGWILADPGSASTIALDGGGAAGERTQAMYFWSYGGVTAVSASAIGGATPPSSGSYTPVFAITTGSARPNTVYFVPDSSTGEWAGGEVSQSNGYIYFGGNYAANINGSTGNYDMLIFDPATGAYNKSGPLKPATPTDSISSGSVASDMAIDAAGDAYLMVSGVSGGKLPTTGATTTTTWLVKVHPGQPGDWTYSKVMPLWYDSNGDGKGDQALTSAGSATYGMSFFGGKLYYLYAAGNTVRVIDPLSGVVTSVPGSTTGGGVPRDLASGQAAAVVTGTVYHDADADGALDGGETGVAGQTVLLYDGSGTVVSTQTTNGSGAYSFLLASARATYYVRVAQPQVPVGTAMVNATQTFATGSSLNGLNPVTQQSHGGEGTGAPRAPYVDPPAGALGSTTSLSSIAAYSKVTITSGNDVSTADFGISATGSYGDAPTSYKSTAAQKGPQHVENPNGSRVVMGEERGAFGDGDNANGHASDDGVTLSLNGTQQPMANQAFVVGNTYRLAATLGGDHAETAKVNAWLAPTNSGDTGTFPNTATASATSNGTAANFSLSPTGSPSGGLSKTWLRVGATTNTGITAPDNGTGQYAPALGSVASQTQTWTSDGEVEDYPVYMANALVRLAVTTDTPGTFTFPTVSNVSSTAPFASNDSIDVSTANTLTYATMANAVISTAGDVVFTTGAVPPNSVLTRARVIDNITGAVVGNPLATIDAVAQSGDTITVPAAMLADGSGDLTLELSYQAVPVLALNQADGQNDSTMGRDLHFTLTSTVPLDPDSLTPSDIQVSATPVGETIDASRLNPRVDSIRPVPGSNDTQFDVVVRVDDSARVTATLAAGTVSTPETGLANPHAATSSDAAITFINPLRATPQTFTLVTGEPHGKDYVVGTRAGAPVPTSNVTIAQTVTQPDGTPSLTLSADSAEIASGSSAADAINVTAAAGDVAANTATSISMTVTSDDPNYDGLVGPVVSPLLFSTDPTIQITKQAYVAMTDTSSAARVVATGMLAPSGSRLTDGQAVCFVYTVRNTSADDWATNLVNVTVTDTDTRLGRNGVIGTIASIPAGGAPVQLFGCTTMTPVDTTAAAGR